jgi:DNA-binding Lrp family transcriptional regulator
MKELLELVEKNPCLPAEQLAVILDKPVEEIRTALQKLADDRIIVQFQTLINWEKAGIDIVTAMIEVRISPQREVGFDAMAERIYRFPEVKSLYLMSGQYDLLVMVEGATLKEVSRFVATKLATIEGVLSTTTHFMLKRYKDAGVIYEDKEEDRRLVVSP